MKKNNRKGFTIVELVIVIAVIGILAGLMIPTFGSVVTDAQAKAAEADERNAYTVYFQAVGGAVVEGAIIDVNGALIQITANGYADATVDVDGLDADHWEKKEKNVANKYDLYVPTTCDDDDCAACNPAED